MSTAKPTRTEKNHHRNLWVLLPGLALLVLTNLVQAQFCAVTGLCPMGGTNCLAYSATKMMPGSMMDSGMADGTHSAALCPNSNPIMVGCGMMTNGTMQSMMSTTTMMGGSGMMMGMGHMGSLDSDSSMMGGMDLGLNALCASNSVAHCINSGGMAGTAEITNGMPHSFMMTNAMHGGVFGMTIRGGLVRLTVGAPVGSRFRIESSDALGSSANWQTMTNFMVTSPTSQMSDTPPRGTQARFYRAVMLP